MENILGSVNNPYTYNDYLMLWQGYNWNGGWVRYNNGKLVYITANGSVEQSNDDGVLGSEENPYSERAYDEMMCAGTWLGGNVRHGDDIVYHVSYEELLGSGSESGSGSGSEMGFGSGSGVGCGASYVHFGHEDIATAHDGKVRISLTWNSGYIGIGQIPPSYLSIHAHVKSPYTIVSENLSACWGSGSYDVRITGVLEYKKGTSSPNKTLNPPSIYSIPDTYRGLPEG